MSSDAPNITASPDGDPAAISVRNVSKNYRLYRRPTHRLAEALFSTKKSYREFQALSDISFDVRSGETLGIVGHNGSGKSTLLQIICGTLQPTSGSTAVQGRVAALLELGAGFNTEFTGRENVYLNATILGMSQSEINEHFQAIEAFAGLGDFINQPVKFYSSGMFVRLAFATAIHSDPDILIVDEALAVGDEAFQRKCFARIEKIQASGATVLFVSHAPSSVLQLCSRAILLDDGEILMDGAPKTVIGQYQRLMNATGELAAEVRADILNQEEPSGTPTNEAAPRQQADVISSLDFFDSGLVPQSTIEYDIDGAQIHDIQILNATGQRVNQLSMGEDYTLSYRVHFTQAAEQIGFGTLIKSVGGLEIAGVTTSRSKYRRLASVSPGEERRVRFPFSCRLVPGIYFINAGVTREIEGEMVFMHRILDGAVFKVAFADDVYATGLVDILTAEPQIDTL